MSWSEPKKARNTSFRLPALLLVFESPLAAFVWLAFHTHNDGEQGGVYWLAGFVAVVIGLLVTAAHYEHRQAQNESGYLAGHTERGNR